MHKILRASALIAASALLLTGCVSVTLPGGSTTAPTSTPTDAPPTSETPAGVSAASGPVISGTGYSFNAPEGWVSGNAAQGTDVVALDPQPVDGFTVNVNVVISPLGLVDLGRVESSSKQELEAYGATDVVVHDRAMLGGKEFTHVSAGMNVQGIDYLVEQFAVNSSSQTYIFTFSYPPSVTQTERVDTATSVLLTMSFG